MEDYNMNIKQKGFSLIEIILVLAIAAVVLVSAFIAYESVRSKSIASNISTKLEVLISNYRTIMSGKTLGLKSSFMVTPSILTYITKDVGQDIGGGMYSLGDETSISIGNSLGGILLISMIIPEKACISVAMNMLNRGYVVLPNSLSNSVKYYGLPNSPTTAHATAANVIGGGSVSSFTPADIAESCKNGGSYMEYNSLANMQVMVSP